MINLMLPIKGYKSNFDESFEKKKYQQNIWKIFFNLLTFKHFLANLKQSNLLLSSGLRDSIFNILRASTFQIMRNSVKLFS